MPDLEPDVILDEPEDGEILFDPEADPSPANNTEGKVGETPAGEKPDGKPDADSAPANQRIQALTDELKQYSDLKPIAEEVRRDPNFLHRLRVQMAREALGETRPAAPVEPPQDEAKVRESLRQAYEADPIGTIAKMADAIADKKMKERGDPTSDSVFDLAVSTYKMANANNPLFSGLADDFDTTIQGFDRKQLRGKSAQEIQSMLDNTATYLLGQKAKRAFQEAQKPRSDGRPAPRMGGGARSNSAGTGTQVKVPREFVVLGRAAGMTNDEIVEDYKKILAEG